MRKGIKIIAIMLAVLFCSSTITLAAGAALLDMRNKIFEESKEIKSLLAKTKNVVLVNCLWDTCLFTMMQLESYFVMLGIFNTIKAEELSEEAVDYLAMWLNDIKRTNMMNIRTFATISIPMEPETKAHLEKLKGYFGSLNITVEDELGRLSLLRKSISKTKK